MQCRQLCLMYQEMLDDVTNTQNLCMIFDCPLVIQSAIFQLTDWSDTRNKNYTQNSRQTKKGNSATFLLCPSSSSSSLCILKIMFLITAKLQQGVSRLVNRFPFHQW